MYFKRIVNIRLRKSFIAFYLFKRYGAPAALCHGRYKGLPAGINQRHGSPSLSCSSLARLPSSTDGFWKIRANIPANAAAAV
jgi:hypothetical protein